ncbi:MAG: hypothetical protein LBT40_17625 [Deltaproteobacteria bacterium]|jgi:hypothetical protein|nr:hypothetical protein [Deltaproteobacteria bacterium]
MNASLNDNDGFWPAVYRFFKSTGVLIFVDVFLSMTALTAVLLLLATLARADAGSYQGTFTFDSGSGYPAEAPRFGGGFGDDEGWDLRWDGTEDPPVTEVDLLGPNASPTIFPESDGSGMRTLITSSLLYGEPGSKDYLKTYYFPYSGFVQDLDGGNPLSEGNLLVMASPGTERINGGRAGAAGYAEVVGGSVELGSSAISRHNTVVLQGVEFHYMGSALSAGASAVIGYGTGVSEWNTAVIRDSTMDYLGSFDTSTYVAGGRVQFNRSQPEINYADGKGYANHNLLWLEGGELANAYGGVVFYLFGGDSPSGHFGDASYNSVVALNTVVKGNLFGGFTLTNYPTSPYMTMTNNTVTVAGYTRVEENLKGGFMHMDTPLFREQVEGNVLNVVLPGIDGIYVGGKLGNFETINFVLSSDAPEGSVALKIGTAAVLYETGFDSKTPLLGPNGEPARVTRIGTIDFTPSASGAAPREGAEYVLIDVGEPSQAELEKGFYGIMTPDSWAAGEGASPMSTDENSGGFLQTTAKGAVGDALDVDLELSATSTRISTRVRGVRASPGVTAVAAAAHGSLAFVGLGLDLLSDSIVDLIASEGQRADSVNGYEPACARPGFAMSYGTTSWDRGSGRFNSTGYSGLFSLSCSREAWGGILAAGVFLEGGEGEYTYSASPYGDDAVSLGGDISYQAAGIYARYDFPHFREGHFYLQGAALTGKAETTFEDRLEGFGNGYKMSRHFSGGSLSAGFVAWLGEFDTLDLSVKYMTLDMRGGHFYTHAGDRVDFAKGRSSRIRVGGVWSHELSARTAFHVGLSADWETAGHSRAYTYGVEIPTPSLKGVTTRLEAGFNFKPRIGSPWTVSITGLAYAGVKRGGAGSVNFSYSF